MKYYKFVGSELDAEGYSIHVVERPKFGKVYPSTQKFSGETVGEWATIEGHPSIREEWQEVSYGVWFDQEYVVTINAPNMCGTDNDSDQVNKPTHYNKGEVECIDAIKAATVGKKGIEAVCVANVIKYLWRYEEKGNKLQDIEKAEWYLKRLKDEAR